VYDSERMIGGNIDGIIDGVFGLKEEGSPWLDCDARNLSIVSGIKSRAYLEVWH